MKSLANLTYVPLCFRHSVVFVCLVLFSSCQSKEDINQPTIHVGRAEPFKQGGYAPDFKLELLLAGEGISNGEIKKQQSLLKMIDRPVLINFWASWCVPCVKEMKSLVELEKELNGKLRVIFVNADSKSSYNDAIKVLKDNLIQSPVFFDSELVTIELYSVSGFPETFLLDKAGRFQYIFDPIPQVEAIRVMGERDWSSKEMVNYFSTMLKTLDGEAS